MKTRNELAVLLGIPKFKVDDIFWDMVDVDKLLNIINKESVPAETLVRPKAEFTPMVAHIVIKGEVQKLLLENLCRDWNNEMYIDYEQSLTSYKAEQK
jgi:hypothetical protein